MEQDAIRTHCAEIERCNQRGGRMLSIVDLIAAGTVTPELAAYALAAIGRGASFLVGARPGGAGKTTVMGALLNFVPPEVELAPADGMETIRDGLGSPTPRRCFICHEIGSGPYYAYLWGQELRAYFELRRAGHMLATNLHADTYEEAREQICVTNGVPDAALRRMNLMFFLSVGRAGRRVAEVWESDGEKPHGCVFLAGAQTGPSRLVSAEAIARGMQTINDLVARDARTIAEVRPQIVAGASVSPKRAP